MRGIEVAEVHGAWFKMGHPRTEMASPEVLKHKQAWLEEEIKKSINAFSTPLNIPSADVGKKV